MHSALRQEAPEAERRTHGVLLPAWRNVWRRLARPPRHPDKKPEESGGVGLAPLAILAVAIALGLSASLLAADRNRTVVQSSLADRTGEMTKVLRERLTIFQYGLRGARGAIVVAGVDKVTLADFRRYIGTRSLDQEFRGALGFGFIRRVAEADLPAFLDTMQRDGRPSFALKQFAPHAGERFVTQFLEPEERNRPALGADVASHDPRRATAIMAMRSGEVQLTPPSPCCRPPAWAPRDSCCCFPSIARASTSPRRSSAPRPPSAGPSCRWSSAMCWKSPT